MKYPHVYYYKGSKRKFIDIKHEPQNNYSKIETRDVTGKVEARRIAKELNGTCYNF